MTGVTGTCHGGTVPLVTNQHALRSAARSRLLRLSACRPARRSPRPVRLSARDLRRGNAAAERQEQRHRFRTEISVATRHDPPSVPPLSVFASRPNPTGGCTRKLSDAVQGARNGTGSLADHRGAIAVSGPPVVTPRPPGRTPPPAVHISGRLLPNSYGHRTMNTRLPVRSALVKHGIARLVLQWVTMRESLVP